MQQEKTGCAMDGDTPECSELVRKPYSAPKLENLGDVRSMTFGGSPGFGDSGMNQMIQIPGMGMGP
ncbi:hypothetical protein ACFL1S_08295 [Pseudomonadota bacterium]